MPALNEQSGQPRVGGGDEEKAALSMSLVVVGERGARQFSSSGRRCAGCRSVPAGASCIMVHDAHVCPLKPKIHRPFGAIAKS